MSYGTMSYGGRPAKGSRKRKGVADYVLEHPLEFTSNTTIRDGKVVDILVCRYCCIAIGARSDRIKEHLCSKRHQNLKLKALTEPAADFQLNDGGLSIAGGVNDYTPDQSNPEQWLVKWDDFNSNFASTFSKLRAQEKFVDVTLTCEGKMIKCHKIVLAASSEYFGKVLTDCDNQYPIIFIKDVKYAELEVLVEFMYKGEVSVRQHDLASLIKAADSLQIKGFRSLPNEMGKLVNENSDQGVNPFGNSNGTSSKGPYQSGNQDLEGKVKRMKVTPPIINFRSTAWMPPPPPNLNSMESEDFTLGDLLNEDYGLQSKMGQDQPINEREWVQQDLMGIAEGLQPPNVSSNANDQEDTLSRLINEKIDGDGSPKGNAMKRRFLRLP